MGYRLRETSAATSPDGAGFADGASSVYMAFPWTASATYFLGRIRYKLYKDGSAVQDLNAYVFDSDGAAGIPGTLLGTSPTALNAASLGTDDTGAFFDFYFSGPLITVSHVYYAALKGLPTDANRPVWKKNDAGSGTQYIATATPTWSVDDTTVDGAFEVYSIDGALVDSGKLIRNSLLLRQLVG